MRVIDAVAAKWEKLALALHFKGSTLDAIRRDTHHQTEDACRRMLQRWLEGEGRKPVNWNTLTKALDDAGFTELAKELNQVLMGLY